MKNINLEWENLPEHQALMVSISGHLDHLNSYNFFDSVEKKHLETQINRFVINLSKTNYLGSKGFGLILKMGDKMKKCGGEVVLIEAQPYILDCFLMMGLGRIIKYFHKKKDALEYLSLKFPR